MIKSISVKNWKNIPNHETWNFTDGIQLIFGGNMSGKSSVLEAVRFAFIGLDSRDSIPNYNLEKECEVCVEFQGADNNVYKVSRSFQKKKKIIELFKLYKVMEKESHIISSNPEDALNLFGINTPIFSDILFLREGDVYRIIYRPKSNLKEEIEMLLNVNRYDILGRKVALIRKRISKQRKNVEMGINQEVDSTQIQKRQNEIKYLTEKIQKCKENKVKLEDKRKRAFLQRNLQKKMNEFSIEIGQRKNQIERKLIDYNLENSEQSYFDQEILTLEKSINELENKFSNIKEKMIAKEAICHQINKQLNDLNDLESKKYSICPLCNQQISSKIILEARSNFEANYNKEKTFLKKLKKESNIIQTEIFILQEKCNKYKIDQSYIKEKQKRIFHLQKETKKLEIELEQTSESETEEHYIKQISKTDDEINKHSFNLGRIQINIDRKQDSFEADIEELRFQEEFLSILEKKVIEFKKNIMDEKLEEAIKEINSFWEQIIEKKIISIKFDKNFSPEIKSSHKALPMNSLANSEKIILNILIRTSLMNQFLKTKTLIFDDPATYLDSRNLKKLANFYNELIENEQISQIIITTFNQEFMKELKHSNLILLD